MTKLTRKFSPGDKVFAKVRGYPPWPARVEGVTDPNTKTAKYKVYFYGTSETATCKVDELFDYNENKEKFGKPIKRKMFHEGIQQLEQELNNDRGKSDHKESVVEESQTENHSTATGTPAPMNVDSDLETGPLIIDEGNKKKPLKRKSSVNAPVHAIETPELKKKRGRGKSLGASIPETANDSQGEETIGNQVVSRSGRKIKPKRFADFSAEDEYDLETTGRARGKSKHEETNENLPTPSSAVGKKKLNVEKEDKKIIKASVNNQKIRLLRMESQLLTLDAQIKTCLALHCADVDKCMEAMNEIFDLPITSLMLKKHPHIVETVKRLRRYIGNLSEWKLTEDEGQVFTLKAELIREKAEDIYTKFKALFTIPQGQSFWQFFSDQVDHFKEVTKDMSEEKMFGLLSDPTTSESAVHQDSQSGDEAITTGDTTAIERELSETSVGETSITSAK